MKLGTELLLALPNGAYVLRKKYATPVAATIPSVAAIHIVRFAKRSPTELMLTPDHGLRLCERAFACGLVARRVGLARTRHGDPDRAHFSGDHSPSFSSAAATELGVGWRCIRAAPLSTPARPDPAIASSLASTCACMLATASEQTPA